MEKFSPAPSPGRDGMSTSPVISFSDQFLIAKISRSQLGFAPLQSCDVLIACVQ